MRPCDLGGTVGGPEALREREKNRVAMGGSLFGEVTPEGGTKIGLELESRDDGAERNIPGKLRRREDCR